MDKIKTVKIKNPDGSISEESYTISVDARNVDVDNGKDLQDTIGNIDVDTDGNISEQLENLNENVDNLNIDIKKKAYFFNTIADMKAANLKAGDYVCTLGYYEANDGGAGNYQIINNNSLVDDSGSVHDLTNGLKAKLIINNEINIKQFGAYGDNTHDDSDAIYNAITYIGNTKTTLIFPNGRYGVSRILSFTGLGAFSLKGLKNGEKMYGSATVGAVLYAKTSLTHLLEFNGRPYNRYGLDIDNLTFDITNCTEAAIKWSQYNMQHITNCVFIDTNVDETNEKFGLITTRAGISGEDASWNKYAYNVCYHVGLIHGTGDYTLFLSNNFLRAAKCIETSGCHGLNFIANSFNGCTKGMILTNIHNAQFFGNNGEVAGKMYYITSCDNITIIDEGYNVNSIEKYYFENVGNLNITNGNNMTSQNSYLGFQSFNGVRGSTNLITAPFKPMWITTSASSQICSSITQLTTGWADVFTALGTTMSKKNETTGEFETIDSTLCHDGYGSNAFTSFGSGTFKIRNTNAFYGINTGGYLYIKGYNIKDVNLKIGTSDMSTIAHEYNYTVDTTKDTNRGLIIGIDVLEGSSVRFLEVTFTGVFNYIKFLTDSSYVGYRSLQGVTTPESKIEARPGCQYKYGRRIWYKDSGTGTTGWKEITANLSGNTVNRPTNPATGMVYFDTQLGKPIWYNGSGWVDSTGTNV